MGPTRAKALVQISFGNKASFTIEAMQAKLIALMIIEAAESSLSDKAVMEVMMNGMSLEDSAKFLTAIRHRRAVIVAELTGQPIEEPGG